MTHLQNVISRVDAAINENVIEHMNILLVELSDDRELNREDRYTQQQRLRQAITHRHERRQEEIQTRREQLTKGGTIL